MGLQHFASMLLKRPVFEASLQAYNCARMHLQLLQKPAYEARGLAAAPS